MSPEIRLGLRENLAAFSLLVVVNAFVGAMVGLERAVVPLLAEAEFGVRSHTGILAFVLTFGIAKALANYLAGQGADRLGRRRILILGWLIGLPMPLMLLGATSWTWVLVANALLGVHQGLAWSATVIMKIDLVGPRHRGLAMGLNEFAGYLALAGAALASGEVAARWGLRPYPFYLGVGIAVVGLGLSLLVRDTGAHARLEAGVGPEGPTLGARDVFARTSLTDRNLSSVSQAGLVNNLNDGAAWGLFPLLFAQSGLTVDRIGWLAALYPAVWGVAQLATGPLSDRVGRKWLIASGMWVQAAALAAVAAGSGLAGFGGASVALGLGTAMVYPTLLAAIGDAAHPSWRASAVGVYRLWRDLGYAAGALIAGLAADAFGLRAAIVLVAALTFASGAVVASRMREERALHPTVSG